MLAFPGGNVSQVSARIVPRADRLCAAHRDPQTRNVSLGLLLLIIIYVVLQSFPAGSQQIESTTRKSFETISHLTPVSWRTHPPRIAKVSALVGEESNELYEGALRKHEEHDHLHGYGLKVFREAIVDGYWRKPTYLLSTIVEELTKPEGDRTEWLMWVGPDVIVRNPQIPLELFLPPAGFSHVHFLGTHNQHGFDSGVFFLRVHEWSARLLIDILALPKSAPAIQQTSNKGQKAFEEVLKRDAFCDHVLYQPRIWYNAYQLNSTDFEGRQGDLFVHFRSVGGDKWSAMDDTLDQLSHQGSIWSIPLERTTYESEVQDYWARLRQGYNLLSMMAARLSEKPAQDAFRRLEYAIRFEADHADILNEALDMAKSVISIEKA